MSPECRATQSKYVVSQDTYSHWSTNFSELGCQVKCRLGITILLQEDVETENHFMLLTIGIISSKSKTSASYLRTTMCREKRAQPAQQTSIWSKKGTYYAREWTQDIPMDTASIVPIKPWCTHCSIKPSARTSDTNVWCLNGKFFSKVIDADLWISHSCTYQEVRQLRQLLRRTLLDSTHVKFCSKYSSIWLQRMFVSIIAA